MWLYLLTPHWSEHCATSEEGSVPSSLEHIGSYHPKSGEPGSVVGIATTLRAGRCREARQFSGLNFVRISQHPYMCATCHGHLSLLELIVLIVFSKDNKLSGCSFCNFPQYPCHSQKQTCTLLLSMYCTVPSLQFRQSSTVVPRYSGLRYSGSPRGPDNFGPNIVKHFPLRLLLAYIIINFFYSYPFHKKP
jgi:hypothetical protein